MAKQLNTKTPAPTYTDKATERAAQADTELQATKGAMLADTLAKAAENPDRAARRLTVDVRPELSRRFDRYCEVNHVKKGPIMRALLEDFLAAEGY